MTFFTLMSFTFGTFTGALLAFVQAARRWTD